MVWPLPHYQLPREVGHFEDGCLQHPLLHYRPRTHYDDVIDPAKQPSPTRLQRCLSSY